MKKRLWLARSAAMSRWRVHVARRVKAQFEAQFEVHQRPAFRAADFAVGLSENAARPVGATMLDA
jgi:hypothetical protein